MQQPTTVVVSQQPTLTVAQPAANPQTLRLRKATRTLGIWQIIFGIVAVIIGIVLQVKLHFWARVYAPGISSGIVFIIGGILCVSSSFHLTNKCLVAANMTFAIISCLCALGESVIAGLAIYYYRTDQICSTFSYYYFGYLRYSYVCVKFPNFKLGLAMYILILVVMLVEFSTSFTVAKYCCKVCCCGTPMTTDGVIVQQPQPYVVQSSMVTSPAPAAYVTTSKSDSTAVINMAPLDKVQTQ